MTRTILLALSLLIAPLAATATATAMPVVGDIVGTGAAPAKAALAKAGCTVTRFEAEGGKVEAICTEDGTKNAWDVTIDPKTGAISDIKKSND